MNTIAENINRTIKESKIDTNLISDGYHTFGELYEHRIALFIELCRTIYFFNDTHDNYIWRSKKHSDGSEWDGWFIMGIGKEFGRQITYHLPIAEWENTEFAHDLEKTPEFDGHTSSDVLERIRALL